MAKHRRRRSSGRKEGGFKSMLGKAIGPLSFVAAFVPQLTNKDTVGNATYAALPNIQKVQFLSNSILSRTTGFNPFPQYGTHSLTINPAGMINKYTGMGIGLLIYGAVAPKGLGGKALAKKVGKGLFWGGAIGGFFDDPNPNTTADLRAPLAGSWNTSYLGRNNGSSGAISTQN